MGTSKEGGISGTENSVYQEQTLGGDLAYRIGGHFRAGDDAALSGKGRREAESSSV